MQQELNQNVLRPMISTIKPSLLSALVKYTEKPQGKSLNAFKIFKIL